MISYVREMVRISRLREEYLIDGVGWGGGRAGEQTG